MYRLPVAAERIPNEGSLRSRWPDWRALHLASVIQVCRVVLLCVGSCLGVVRHFGSREDGNSITTTVRRPRHLRGVRSLCRNGS